jgi:predicted alpha/beta-fold hydrolase
MKQNDYKPSFFYKSGHINTIVPTIFRKVEGVNYNRERIDTPDDDFLDLDWSLIDNAKGLAVISHGLEGNSDRAYVKGMVKMLNSIGLDCLAWNFRTCGGETNNLLRMYHNGVTDDLETVITYAINKKKYSLVVLVGFSMGGNLSLMYLGQKRENLPPQIKGAVVFSVPCDLEDSSKELAKFSCKLYMKRFLIKLHKKIKVKMEKFPGQIDDKDYHKIKSFKDFDDRYTAPLHGFKNAKDYWAKCSSYKLLKNIKVKTYIINAEDDPFLGGKCYPYDEVKKNTNLHLKVPKYGGHVGFVINSIKHSTFAESEAARLIKNEILKF